MSQDVPDIVEIHIKCNEVKSLCWDEGSLLDLAGGYRRIHLSGKVEELRINWTYRFDRSICLRVEKDLWCVLYKNRGAKGLVLKNGKLVREVNRSYYCAEAYDYPIALTQLLDTMVALVHCPEQYNKLEIEDAETGARLTTRTGTAADFFHSRLEISPGGRYLVSGGWIWHPWCTARVFDLAQGLEDVTTLNGEGMFPSSWPKEVDSATFSDRNQLVVASMHEGEEEESSPPTQLGIWNLAAQAWIAHHLFDEPLGTVFATRDWALAIYNHPKLIRLSTGEIVQRWPHISTGTQRGPINIGDPHPLVAFDPVSFRLAVATPTGLTVPGYLDGLQ